MYHGAQPHRVLGADHSPSCSTERAGTKTVQRIFNARYMYIGVAATRRSKIFPVPCEAQRGRWIQAKGSSSRKYILNNPCSQAAVLASRPSGTGRFGRMVTNCIVYQTPGITMKLETAVSNFDQASSEPQIIKNCRDKSHMYLRIKTIAS